MANARAQHLRQNLTGPERKLWSALRRLRKEGFHLRRQVPFDNFVLDFASHRERLVVEVDGSQHAEPGQRAHDEARTRIIEARGYLVVRYTNYDVLWNLDGVMEQLLVTLKERRHMKFTAMPPHISAEFPPPDPSSLRYDVSTAPRRGR